ncbi:MAG: VWA domain-containing protein [Planctomycetes bacterium]|nr:VWA domain-containing protein [Planctomycetota bacterium]
MRLSIPLIALFAATAWAAQSPTSSTSSALRNRPWSSNIVLPQSRAFHVDRQAPAVRVNHVRADILLVDGVATTTLDVAVVNQSDRDSMAELLLPVPDGAVVSGFDFEGKAADSTAVVLARDEARSTFDSIVARLRDPALLEFAGAALVRSSVLPVPKLGTQMVRVRYEHIMPVEGSRWDYVLPRSESLASDVQWDVTVEVRSARSIADVYSPTHDLPRVNGDAHRVSLRARAGMPMEAGPLRVSVLLGEGPLSTTLFTSADAEGPGGWFLLLAGIGEARADAVLPPREVTLVLDRSGSMAGNKFDQARAAARQVIEGLAVGEAIQIIDYSDTVERFAAEPVVKSADTLPALRAYLDGLTTNGGTNLAGALEAALAAPVGAGRFPVVLVLTDGLATVGEKREHMIRAQVETANAHGRRVFTFGVGNDVNASLLDAVAVQSRARATYVRPDEDVEVAVGRVFKDLSGPTVTDLALAVRSASGNADTRIVRDIYPRVMPDLYRSDRLVVVGRYTAAEGARFELKGKRAGVEATWTLDYDFARALPRNDFVRRLWAMRRIAGLEDELRLAGADPSKLAALKDDARFSEIASEMLTLATRFGILTNSTAFLALEGTQLGNGSALLAEACSSALQQADARSGLGSVVSQQNIALNRSQAWVNGANCQYGADGVMQTTNAVQTVQGRTFFRRGSQWIDGRLALAEGVTAPDRVIEFGTPEYMALVNHLSTRGQAGQLSIGGEILLRDGNETILVRPPSAAVEPVEAQAPVDDGC